MSFEAWIVFALFWALFVTTPGPNAVNCIQTSIAYGFRSGMWCVAAILTQSSLFLLLSAAGITALIAASPTLFFWVRLIGAAVLIAMGIRAWRMAGEPLSTGPKRGGSLYFRALAIATLNAKSVAGYLAAFSQFVSPDVPIWTQMQAILPTALSLTALSYTGYCALGAWLGRLALGAIGNLWLRRGLALCFIAYGAALAATG